MTMQLFTGKQYLQIDIANNYGLDKEDWDDRLDWFAQAEGNLERCNCRSAGELGHFFCGWDHEKNLPQFMSEPKINSRKDR